MGQTPRTLTVKQGRAMLRTPLSSPPNYGLSHWNGGMNCTAGAT